MLQLARKSHIENRKLLGFVLSFLMFIQVLFQPNQEMVARRNNAIGS